MALIALLLASGLREGEVVQLEIDDRYQTYGGVPALRVKAGKGAGQRLRAIRNSRPDAGCYALTGYVNIGLISAFAAFPGHRRIHSSGDT